MIREQSFREREEEEAAGRMASLNELKHPEMTEESDRPTSQNGKELNLRTTTIPEPVFTLFAFLARQGIHISDLFRRPGNINQMKVSFSFQGKSNAISFDSIYFDTIYWFMVGAVVDFIDHKTCQGLNKIAL